MHYMTNKERRYILYSYYLYFHIYVSTVLTNTQILLPAQLPFILVVVDN